MYTTRTARRLVGAARFALAPAQCGFADAIHRAEVVRPLVNASVSLRFVLRPCWYLPKMVCGKLPMGDWRTEQVSLLRPDLKD